jgi:phospholipase D1/2
LFETLRNKRIETRHVKGMIFLLFLIVCAVASYHPAIRSRISMEWVNSQLAYLTEIANRPYGPAAFIGISIAIILVQLPGILPVVASGLIYPLPTAFLYSWIAASAGTTITFLIARYFIRDLLRPKLANSILAGANDKLETNGLTMMVMLRLVLLMAPPLNWLLGATNIKVRDYLLGTMIGLAPVVLAIVWMTSRLKTIKSGWDLLRPEMFAVVGIFAGLFVAILFAKKKFLTSETAGKPDKG